MSVKLNFRIWILVSLSLVFGLLGCTRPSSHKRPSEADQKMSPSGVIEGLCFLRMNRKYAAFFDQAQLGFKPVHVLFFGHQYMVEQIPAAEVSAGLTIDDSRTKVRNRDHLKRQIAFEHLFDVLTNHEFSQILQIG